ncbi:MAG: DUF2971 domain-containing protein [Candidatus Thiodiazotropha sp.]|nr:DUF2971 domain-containing protein [Candidatus Thiodiazotropha taylori]
MSKDEIKEFEQRHPHPDQDGLVSLFRFSRANVPEDRLRHLFVEGKLFHPLPNQFNDPFECKPHFRWPESAKKVRRIRQHLIKIARADGKSKKEAEALVASSMAKEGFIQTSIFKAVRKTLGEVRVCSFTSSKENLLFWAHYADSHRGFCVEYDATILPISYAFKVRYTKKYPEVDYPAPGDARGLQPVLIKSKEWAYEEEFRTTFVPTAERQPRNDGESLILYGNEIKNVYFGALMDDAHKELLAKLLREGPFKPGIWQTELSPSSFELRFRHLENVGA